MTEQSRRSGQDLAMSLAGAKQNITLLRSQLKNSRIDPDYLDARLASFSALLEDVEAERVNTGQQQRVAKLYEVSRAVGSSLNLQTVLNHVMDAIIELTEAERGFLMLLNDDGNLEVRVARNFDQETLDNKEFAVSQTITHQVFENGEPVVTTNAQEDPRYAGQMSIITHGMRSIMASPLRARGQITGVVYVDNRIKAGIFSEDDLATLDTFASQAAVAIDNARLYSETDAELQDRLEELRMLQWIDRQLNETLQLEKSLNLTVEWAARLSKADNGIIGLVDNEREVLIRGASYGEDIVFADKSEIMLSMPLLQQAANSELSILDEQEKDGVTHTLLCTAIRFTGEIIGYLLLSSNKPDAFDENAQTLISRMAERAASSIQNSRLYAEVDRANRAKSEFVSMVAHELKVPMTSIRGYASMIEMTGGITERQVKFVHTIENNVDRMQVMVEDLNDISRIESGHLDLAIENVDLHNVFEQARDGVLAQIEEREHILIEKIDDDLPVVRGSKARLIQVLVNLLSNAYKYTPNNGEITLQAERQGDFVHITVADNGIGMTPDQLSKLGSKFFRADHDHVLQEQGTGLGFAITRNLIDLMEGDLQISSSLGKGSSFSFKLPIVGES